MITIENTELYLHNFRTRMPFKYGIASMTGVPHLFVKAHLVVDGQPCVGIASDFLPPKWFTKTPDSSYEQDVRDMLRVVEQACASARDLGPAPTLFRLWRGAYESERVRACGNSDPPLLWNFGVSLVERAAIDAFCRSQGLTFAEALRRNALGMEMREVHGAFAKDEYPASFLPPASLPRIHVRHTVGLGDWLRDGDVPDDARPGDGLPESLDKEIERYGLTRFKIKIGGDADANLSRLSEIAALFNELFGDESAYAFTLDGNEQFQDMGAFQEFWRRCRSHPRVRSFLKRLVFVEQPVHRDRALSEATGKTLARWSDAPPIIVDESDIGLDTLPNAVALGYRGISHKNCKGVFKGIANACLVIRRNRERPAQRPLVISAEDLCNVGPVALAQDLAVVAALGIDNAERNGHHYVAGLSAYPKTIQEPSLEAHPDLYHRTDSGLVAVSVKDGAVRLGSVNAAPFGYGFDLDPAVFTPHNLWSFGSLQV